MKNIEGLNKREFITQIKGKEIIFWGMGQMFSEAIEGLSEIKELPIAALIDNSKTRRGEKILVQGNEYLIESPSLLENIDVTDKVLLITSKYYRDIIKQCEKIESLATLECYTWVDVYWNESLLERAIAGFRSLSLKRGISDREINEKIEIYREKASLNENYTIIPKINIIVTEKCSLSCKDCRALIPHVKNPQNVPFEEVKEEIDIILSAVDDIIDMEPIGGEPFVYPDLAKVLDYMASSEKINTVVVSTNGTIVPNDRLTAALKNPKVFVCISDYGHIEKMAQVVSHFEKNNISFEIESGQIWFDVGGVENRNRTEDELKEEYRNCYCQYLVKYVWDNKIWVCPRAPRLSALNIFCDENDFQKLSKNDNAETVRDKILQTYNVKYAGACNYCSQGDLDIKFVRAGVQTDNRIFNSEYTIVKRKEYEELKGRS